jgi:transposase
MAMGKKKRRQESLWVSTADLPSSPGHPFYRKLNAILDEAGFDAFAESECRGFYAPVMGRPGLAPGRYFRLLMVGYFEGLDSERGIAWRAADSLAIRKFVGLGLDEGTPDHSTISRTRRLIDVETHRAVFTWILKRLAVRRLLRGKTIGIDATTLEANAAMRSIVRRDTGEGYQKFLARLAESSGIQSPTREALARLDRRRRKRTSNKDWTNPSDPDSKITKMKDGRTHLAHKAEHAVDMTTGAIVAVTVQDADRGDTTSIDETLKEAGKQIDAVSMTPEVGDQVHEDGVSEVVADRGYHSDRVLTALEEQGLRSYIPEPKRPRRKWDGDMDAQLAVYANRRRLRGKRGRRLLRSRGELIERSFAHLYQTGGMRRTHLRGHENILKRLLIHSGAFNLGLLLRKLVGTGSPRGLQGYPATTCIVFSRAIHALSGAMRLWIRHVTPQCHGVSGPVPVVA